jgi:hypothetical protein
MPDRVLQNHYCVAALQHRLSYNGVMSLSVSKQSDESVSKQSGEPMASTRQAAQSRRAAGPRRASARFCRAGLIAVTLLGTGVLAAACGMAPAPTLHLVVGHVHRPHAFVSCMRTHGEPNLPDLVVEGNSVRITITPGSGVNPRSKQFTAAFKACRYLTSPGSQTTS